MNSVELRTNGRNPLPQRFDGWVSYLGIEVNHCGSLGRVGQKLWPSAISLADACSVLQLPLGLLGVELGPGLGLAGMLVQRRGVGMQLIESDLAVCNQLKETIVRNAVGPQIICMDFKDFSWPTDVLIGSDIFYPSGAQGAVAGFIARNWTHRGPCLFVDPCRAGFLEFTAALEFFGLQWFGCELHGAYQGFEWTTSLIQVVKRGSDSLLSPNLQKEVLA